MVSPRMDSKRNRAPTPSGKELTNSEWSLIDDDDDVTCGTSTSAPTLSVGSTAEAKSFVDTLSFESQKVLLAELMQRMSMASVSKL